MMQNRREKTPEHAPFAPADEALEILPWLAAGGVLAAAGLLLIVASQWIGWSAPVRLVFFGALVLFSGCLLLRRLAGSPDQPGGDLFLEKGAGRWDVPDSLGLVFVLSVGLFLIVHGQTFVSGAGAETLFVVWALLTLPWALLLRRPLTGLLVWALGLTSGLLMMLQAHVHLQWVAAATAFWCAAGVLLMRWGEANPEHIPAGVGTSPAWRAVRAILFTAGVLLSSGWMAFRLGIPAMGSTDAAPAANDFCMIAVFLFLALERAEISAEAKNNPSPDASGSTRRSSMMRSLRSLSQSARTAWATAAWLLANAALARISLLLGSAWTEILIGAGVLLNGAAVVLLARLAKHRIRLPGGLFTAAGVAAAVFAVLYAARFLGFPTWGAGLAAALAPYGLRVWRKCRVREKVPAQSGGVDRADALLGIAFTTVGAVFFTMSATHALDLSDGEAAAAASAIFLAAVVLLRLRWMAVGAIFAVVLLMPETVWPAAWVCAWSSALLIVSIGRHPMNRSRGLMRACGLLEPLLAGTVGVHLLALVDGDPSPVFSQMPWLPTAAAAGLAAASVLGLEKRTVLRRPAILAVLLGMLLFSPEAAPGLLAVLAARLPDVDRKKRIRTRTVGAVASVLALYVVYAWGLTGGALLFDAGLRMALGGSALLAVGWMLRPVRQGQPVRFDIPEKRSNTVRLGWALLAASVLLLAGGVVRDAVHVSTGRTVWAELVPVDPRDVLMGDFMALAYAVDEQPQARTSEETDKRTVREYVRLALNEGVLSRMPDHGEKSPGAGALLLPVDLLTGDLRLPRRFFFPQGEADHWAKMRWAALSCSGVGENKAGRCLLLGLVAKPGELPED